MADLRVNVAGVEFKNPVIPASGAFGYGREYEKFYPLSKLGGIAIKGTTLEPRQGNPGPRVAETPSGMLNSVGLQNGGLEKFLSYELPNLVTKDTRIVANIAGATVEECAEYLGIGRSACYALARQAETNGVPFYTFRIGGRLLISKKSFLDFMDANHL